VAELTVGALAPADELARPREDGAGVLAADFAMGHGTEALDGGKGSYDA
ncbi:MAG: hypothetical protein K0S65_829, partial [Labilithrix sp.]|nr:hypothetical protein [Labilithrix sp.]